MPRAVRVCLLVLLTAALSGCFLSTSALIGPGEADHPFAGKTAYTLSRSADDGRHWTEEGSGTLGTAGDAYVMDGEADTAFTVRRAFGDYYIGQQQDHGVYYYDLLHVEGDHVYLYGFTCGEEDRRHVQSGLIDTVTTESDGLHCTVSDFGKLAKVFHDRLEAGALPKSLYIIR